MWRPKEMDRYSGYGLLMYNCFEQAGTPDVIGQTGSWPFFPIGPMVHLLRYMYQCIVEPHRYGPCVFQRMS